MNIFVAHDGHSTCNVPRFPKTRKEGECFAPHLAFPCERQVLQVWPVFSKRNS